MKPLGFVAAGFIAIAGALVWGFISWSTNFEIGILAWGIGLVIGLGAAVCGSHGVASGLICAVLALGSIGLGKYFAVDWAISGMSGELSSLFEESLTPAAFNELKQDAEDFKKVKRERDYAKFMTSHDYADARPSAEEIDEFKVDQVPMLERIASGELTYETWREEAMGSLESLAAEGRPSTLEVLKSSFSLFDLLWAFLGVSTAFRVGSGGGDDD